MIAISIFSGLYCNAHPVIARIAQTTGYTVVTDQEIITEAAALSGMAEDDLANAFPTASDNGKGAHTRAEAIGWLRLVLARKLSARHDLIFHGYSAFLLPSRLKHILRVCLISEMNERMAEGTRAGECSGLELRDRIFADDLMRANWVMAHTESCDPWDKRLYDLVLPVASLGIGSSACRIVEQLCTAAVNNTDCSGDCFNDFLLSAEANAAIGHWGDSLCVTAREGVVTMKFNENKQLLAGVARDMIGLVSGLSGVRHVHVGTGSSFNEAEIFPRSASRPAETPRMENPEDAMLVATVKAVLAVDGYPVTVRAERGTVTLTITDHATMLRVVARKLGDLASGIEGLARVDVGVGRTYHRIPGHHNVRQQLASRTLLDDARKFDLYISLRLQVNNNISITMYDGDSTAQAAPVRMPGVVLLDADRPGLNGGETVRLVQLANPGAKVLVLSGIETGREREDYLRMGASAYLNKPVTASILGNAIKGATADVHCSTS